MSATATRSDLSLRARAELELRKRRSAQQGKSVAELYRYDPVAYVRDRLGWEPWEAQRDVLEAYIHVIHQQEEQRDFELGLIERRRLEWWAPGDVIKRHIRISSGHGIGKTKILAAIQNHHFDCFDPGVGYSFAPTGPQVNDLLWKEIRADRAGSGLQGLPLVGRPEMKTGPKHFAKGRASDDSGGRGQERIQGQHEAYMLFLVDEAEGVADFVYDGIEGMETGGVVVVIYAANPRSRTSRFHKLKGRGDIQSFTISCLDHPNVVAGREVISGAVRRQWVEGQIEKACDVVDEHDTDEMTFEAPFDVQTERRTLPAGTILKPDPEFMWRVLGRAPANTSDDTFVPLGRYEAACKRTPRDHQPHRARMGLDVARYGADVGTLWVRHNGAMRRAGRFARKDTNVYARAVKAEALRLRKLGVNDLEIRIDAGGGFGGGVADKLNIDEELLGAFPVIRIIEIHFNAVAYAEESYADAVTEMYAEAAETIRAVAIVDPPESLEGDLCDRAFTWINRKGTDVRRLVPKEKFRALHRRSPDDGDGFVMAAAPDFLWPEIIESIEEGLEF